MNRLLLSFLVCIPLITGCTAASFIDSVIDRSYFEEPKIKYGEFPFLLSYIVDGKPNTLRDTVICEYDGKMTDAGGSRSKWTMSFASGRERVVLRSLENGDYVYFPTGGCKTYMDDWPNYVKTDLKSASPALTKINDSLTTHFALDAEVAENKYQVRIVRLEFTSPISEPEVN